jgi:hypothetical protein
LAGLRQASVSFSRRSIRSSRISPVGSSLHARQYVFDSRHPHFDVRQIVVHSVKRAVVRLADD